MKRALLLPLLGVLAACGTVGGQASPVPADQRQQVTTTTSAAATVPPAPKPVNDGTCPYLTTGFVAEANGQRVPKVKLSTDEPHPACFFYANATEVQLSVWVFEGEPGAAEAVVDRAAPVSDSNPATEPAGWEGGSLTNDGGAVYAVAKGGSAVVVTSNQKQTIKAREVAKQVVANLGL